MNPSAKRDEERVIIGEKGVSYGLQLRKPVPGGRRQPAPTHAKKKSIFGDDEEDEEEEQEERPMSHVGRMIAQQAAAAKTNKKVLEMQAEALQQDANIFEYDSHFDSIQQARSAPKVDEKVSRKSKYIANLLETAEQRKREQDVLYEKRLEKERKAEEHIYGTTESFVTSAYRKKLEEEEKWKMEQEKKRREEEDQAVEKKGHMGDFYRNLFKSNVDFVGSGGRDEEIRQDREDTKDKEDDIEIKVTSEGGDATNEMEAPKAPEVGTDTLPVVRDTPPLVVLEEETEEDKAKRLKREREEKIKAAKELYMARRKIKE